jgi:hypothetical protein
MAATTTGLRYPALTDQPNGPSQIEDLADDIESYVVSRLPSATVATGSWSGSTTLTTTAAALATTSTGLTIPTGHTGLVLLLATMRFEGNDYSTPMSAQLSVQSKESAGSWTDTPLVDSGFVAISNANDVVLRDDHFLTWVELVPLTAGTYTFRALGLSTPSDPDAPDAEAATIQACVLAVVPV